LLIVAHQTHEHSACLLESVFNFFSVLSYSSETTKKFVFINVAARVMQLLDVQDLSIRRFTVSGFCNVSTTLYKRLILCARTTFPGKLQDHNSALCSLICLIHFDALNVAIAAATVSISLELV